MNVIELFDGNASVSAFWKILTTMLMSEKGQKLTQAKLSTQSGLSPPTISKIVKALYSLNIIDSQKDYSLKGKSKHYLILKTPEIVYLVAKNLGFSDQAADTYKNQFSSWLYSDKYQLNTSKIPNNYLTIFDNKFVEMLVKKSPLLFLTAVIFFDILRWSDKNKLTPLDSIPNKVIFFGVILSGKLLLEDIPKNILPLLFVPELKKWLNILFKEEMQSLKEFNSEIKDSIENVTPEKEKSVVKSLKDIYFNIKEQKYWAISDNKATINYQFSDKELEDKIDHSAELIIKFPLKSGGFHKVSIRPVTNVTEI